LLFGLKKARKAFFNKLLGFVVYLEVIASALGALELYF